MGRITKKILNLQDKVEILLTRYPSLRDCDKLLANKMWDVEIRKMNLNPKTITVDMFFSLYEKGSLSNAEFIARARRKLQKQKEELRGETWYERHKEAEETRVTI
jgi:hypothetical protein